MTYFWQKCVCSIYTCPLRDTSCTAPQQHLNFFAARDPEWNHSTVELGICELLPQHGFLSLCGVSRQPKVRTRSSAAAAIWYQRLLSHCVLFAMSVAKNTGCCSHREIMASSVRNPPDSLSAACLRHVSGRIASCEKGSLIHARRRHDAFQSINTALLRELLGFCLHTQYNEDIPPSLSLVWPIFHGSRITFLSRFARPPSPSTLIKWNLLEKWPFLLALSLISLALTHSAARH